MPCECRVFFVAHEHVSSDNLISFETTRVQANEPLRFPAGLGQEYKSPSTVFLDVSSYEAGELVHVPNSSMFPLVVQLSTSVQAGESPQSQVRMGCLCCEARATDASLPTRHRPSLLRRAAHPPSPSALASTRMRRWSRAGTRTRSRC